MYVTQGPGIQIQVSHGAGTLTWALTNWMSLSRLLNHMLAFRTGSLSPWSSQCLVR